jgi:YidC/Oxa1 family membrane protein insertase
MEKRLLIAIVLSVVVILLWQALFLPPKPKRVKKIVPQQMEEEILPQEEVSSLDRGEKEEEAEPLFSSPIKPEYTLLPPEKEIIVNTDLYAATFSSRGARLKSLKLLRHKNKIALPKVCFIFPFSLLYSNKQPRHGLELKELVSTQESDSYPLQTTFEGSDLGYFAEAPFTANTSSLKLDTVNPQGEIVLSWQSKEGITFIKKFTFLNEGYYIDYDFTIANNSPKPLEGSLSVEWASAIKQEDEKKKGGFFGGLGGDVQQFLYLISDEVKRIEVKDIQENRVFPIDIKWAAFEEKYFISSLIPDNTQDLKLKLYKCKNNIVSFRLISPLTGITPNAQQTFSYSLYLGPKDMGHLEKGRGELGRVLSFGKYLDPVAKPMLFILKLFYKFIPNYGLAIIILSALIKILFWPLTHKSQKSMKEMQKIQPKIAELKEKYKNNKEELQRRTMELYRTHKVNPLGGCLPILIQLPVFFALYRVLLNSIELRHAPFISFWINDLSAKDPTYISPLLMGASMFIQQKMTPTVGDPAQAKMMLAMPVVFTFLFLNFPSGLVIYWLVTNILSIGQQYYINKHSF